MYGYKYPVVQMVKNPPASGGDARDLGSVPSFGGSPREGMGNPHQCSCLENSKDKGAWWSTIHGVTKNQTQLSEYACTCVYINIYLQVCILDHSGMT